MSRFTALLIPLFFLSVGCTPTENGPVQRHGGAAVESSGEVPLTAADVGLQSLDFARLSEQTETGEWLPLREVLETLKPLVLDPRHVEDFEYWSHPSYERYLGLYNLALITAHQNYPTEGLVTEHLDHYRSLLLEGCRPGTLDDCVYLPLLRKDPQSAYFAKVYASESTEIKERFRFFYLANLLQGRLRDESLDNAVYLYSQDMFHEFLNVETSSDRVVPRLTLKSLSPAQTAEYRFFLEFLSLIFGRMQSLPTESGFRSVTLHYFKWLESEELSELVGNNVYSALSRLMVQFLDEPEVAEAFRTIVLETEQRDPNSYSQRIQSVKQHSPEAFERLNITTFDIRQWGANSGELQSFYIIRKIFNLESGQLHSILWDSGTVDQARFLEIMESFLQVHFVHTVIQGHLQLSGFFRERLSGGLERSEILDNTIQYARGTVSSIWANYKSHSQNLEQFYFGHFRDVDLNTTEDPVTLNARRVRRFFTQLDVNIAVMSEFPHLLVLGYYAVEAGYREAFRGGPNSTNMVLTPEVYVNWLLKGQVPSLFGYQGLRHGLNPVQVQWMLYYFIKLDVAEIFDLDFSDFFSLIFDKFTQHAREQLHLWNERLEYIDDRSSNFTEFLNICEAIGDEPYETLNFHRARVSFEDFRSKLFYGFNMTGDTGLPPMSTVISSLAGRSGGAKPLERMIDEAVEVLRSDVDPKLRTLLTIRSVFTQQRGDDPALRAFNTAVTELERDRNVLTRRVRLISDQVPECWTRFLKAEVQRAKEIFSMNLAFINDLYQLMSALQELDAYRLQTVREIKAQQDHTIFARYPDLIEDLSLFDSVNDWIERHAHIQTYGRINPDYLNQHRRDAGIRRDRSGRYYWVEGRHRLALRLAYFLMHGYRDQEISFRAQNFSIDVPQTMQELVRSFSRSVGYQEPIENIYIPSFSSQGWTQQDLFASDMVQFYMEYHRVWHSKTFVPYVLRHFVRGQVANLRYMFQDQIDVTQIVSCDETCHQRQQDQIKEKTKELADLLESHLGLFQLESELAEMRRLSLRQDLYFNTSSINQPGPHHLFIEGFTGNYIPLLEDAFSFVISVRLGHRAIFSALDPTNSFSGTYRYEAIRGYLYQSDRDIAPNLISRPDIFWNSTAEFQSLREREDVLFFEMEPEVAQHIEASAKYPLVSQMRVIHGFMQAADELSQERELPFYQFSEDQEPGQPGYLPLEGLRSLFLRDIQRFHRSTQGEYLPPELEGHRDWTY